MTQYDIWGQVRRHHAASTWVSWETCSGGHSTTRDHHVGKATGRHSAETTFPFSPQRCSNVSEEAILEMDALASAPRCLSHPAIQAFPIEAQISESKD